MKEDGVYCGSPSLRDSKYCYYHLQHRGRRLRRARALRNNVPYRLEIESLDNLYAIRIAITEIVQAMGSGQLDQRTAGKMLYGIQQVTALNRRIAEAEAETAQSNDQQPTQPNPRVQEYPQFEHEFGIAPGADIDAEIDWTLQKADQLADLRTDDGLPTPPPGVRPGTARYRLFCDETYQMQRYRIHRLEEELREYHEMKRRQATLEIEKMKKEMLAATPAEKPKPEQSPAQSPISSDSAPKKPAASVATRETEQEATRSA